MNERIALSDACCKTIHCGGITANCPGLSPLPLAGFFYLCCVAPGRGSHGHPGGANGLGGASCPCDLGVSWLGIPCFGG